MNNEELIKKAERGEWDLECDKQVLDQMKNVAQKLESRSANTKTNIDSMVLGVDELKVKLNNLNKINSIRNTHYCENVLREDDTKDDSSVRKRDIQKTEPKTSQQVAIDNGLKLMSKCFDKNVVRHDPSGSSSETTTSYRPIDKYANVLPHLIGSDEWNRKWHAGILDKDPAIERRRQPTTTTSSHEEESQSSNLISAKRDSLESVAKSVSSSGGDQMVINSLQPSGKMFDDNNEDEMNVPKEPIVPSSSMFRPPPDTRRIVNLFNDEPPSLESSPSAIKRPVNLFDDYGSVDSFPTSDTSEERTKSQAVSGPSAVVQPPVDLFNDNEFESFIDKLERKQQGESEQSQSEKPSKSVATSADKNPIVGDMKKIADEIKKVQLRKADGGGDAASNSKPIVGEKKSTTTTAASSAKSSDFKQMLSKTLEKQAVGDVKSKPKMDDVKSNAPPPLEHKVKKTAANLFDDDDDTEVIAPSIDTPKSTDKSSEKPKETQRKTKLTNLFDDDDEDDPFESIFKKKSSDTVPSSPKPITSVSKKLFADDDVPEEKSIFTSSKTKSLFDDEHEVKATPPPKQLSREAIKTLSGEKKETIDEKKHIEKPEKVIDSEPEAKIDAEQHSRTIQNTSRIDGKVKNTPTAASSGGEKLPTRAIEVENSPRKDESQPTPFNVPFLSDEPPDDDTWATEDKDFDEHDNRVNDFNTPKPSSYSTMPLFDELPPEDDFVVSKQPPIPEPNFYSSDEEPVKMPTMPKKVETVKPDNPSNTVSTGIRGKLDDLFKKQQEKETASVKDKDPPKKLAGKLSDMKINVGALMPGMRPPPMKKPVEEEQKSPSESFEKKDEGSEKPAKVTAPTLSTKATDVSNNEERLNLLNNDITKSRAKIQVKRRPSTRQARQASYKKTMSAYIDEEESKDEKITTRPMSAVFSDEIVSKSVEFNETKSVESSKKILTSSIFGDESDTEDILVSKVSSKESTMTTKTSTSKSSVVTNKIPVFYDDEADTKKMLDEQRRFDEEGKQKRKEEIKKSSIFDDESDDDLFGKKSKTSSSAPAPVPKSTTTKSQSLFDDEDEGENLFTSKSTKVPSKSKKLFESDDDEPSNKPIASSSKPKTEKSISKSLFGDDDDDDDLFSSKPKLSTKSSSASKPTTTAVKKPPSKVVDDPLKDLWND